MLRHSRNYSTCGSSLWWRKLLTLPPSTAYSGMSTLNELSQDLINLEWNLEQAANDEARAVLVSAYLETTGAAKDKIDGYASLISELEARAAYRKAEAARLAGRAKQDEGTAKFLRSRLLAYFDCHNITTLETARYKLTSGNVGGKLPLVLLIDPTVRNRLI